MEGEAGQNMMNLYDVLALRALCLAVFLICPCVGRGAESQAQGASFGLLIISAN
jgi:hypothetical protein